MIDPNKPMEVYAVCARIMDTPHALIAGTTGAGKSVLLNSCIVAGIASMSRFIMIDLKRVELKCYSNILNTMEYVTEPEDVPGLLDRIIKMMDIRYQNMVGRQSNDSHIYIVIDELADLVSNKGVLDKLVKIGRLGRAANIHLLCATQDPSRNTLSAQLMQNFTTKVALRCENAIESKQIIGRAGAELLPKYGKAYLKDANGFDLIDVPMTPEEDIEFICNYLQNTPSIKTRVTEAFKPSRKKQSFFSRFFK